MTNPTAQLFRHAADIIEKRGWCQGMYMDFDGDANMENCRVCGSGALNVAAGYAPDDLAKETIAADISFVRWLGGHEDYVTIPIWNDDPDRTAEEVVATFRAYAEHLDAAA